MRPAIASLLGRLLLLALPAGLMAHAPQAAAQSGISYASGGGVYVSAHHQTNTRIVAEYWGSDGRLLGTRICPAPGTCNLLPLAGTARYAMVVEYDGNREALVAETCNGVASNVPQGQCINGPLHVTMRVRSGLVRYRFVADERPGRPYAAPASGGFGNIARLEFPSIDEGGGNKYWNARGFRDTAGLYPTPAGQYHLSSPNLAGHCKPVRTNPDEGLSVLDGQTTEFTVRYTGTRCTLTVHTSSTPAEAGVVASDPEGLNCRPLTSGSRCSAEFNFDSMPRLIAHPGAGWQARFGRNFTGCSHDEPDPAVCEILADGDHEITAQFTRATSPPPPPPPVTLSAVLGPATPVDGDVAKGSQGVSMLQLLLTPANGVARLNALTLQASGSGRDDLDLNEVRVHLDSNGNGLPDAGEPVLARGRFVADNGSQRLVLDTPLEFSTATAMVVVADIANTVHSAAAAGGVLMAVALLGFLRSGGRTPSRAARCGLAIVLVVAAGLVACGGDDGRTPGDASPPTTPPVTPPVTPPAPVLLSYQLQLTAVEATDTASAPATLSVAGLPLTGARIDVEQ